MQIADSMSSGHSARAHPVRDGASEGWFHLDPQPRFAVDFQGRVQAVNAEGGRVLKKGLLATARGGLLKFGSPDSDAAFLRALRRLEGAEGGSTRLVLRRRDSEWFAATLHRATDQPLAILALRCDVAISKEALAAIADAFHLTRSEGEILQGLLDGGCAKAVAIDMTISEHTVRSHLRSIYAKLGVKGLSGAIRLSCHLMI